LRKELDVSDLISRTLLCGLGLANLTKDAIQKTAEEFVEHYKMSEGEGRKLVKDFQRRSAEAEKALEKKVETAVHKVLKNLNLQVIHERPKGKGAGKKRTAKSGRATKAGSQ
jgi:polyhydroxyalkanoate synthesis regulator phasin